MTNHISLPKAVLDSKDSYYLIKTKNKILIGILEALLFFAVFEGCGMVSSVGAGIIGGLYNAICLGNALSIREMINTEWYMATELICRSTHILLGLLLCVFFQKRKPASMGFTRKKAIPQYLIGLAAGFIIFSAAVLIAVAAGAATIEVNHEPFSTIVYIGMIAGWVFQGMAEEVLCRGYFLVSLQRRLSVPASVIISSLAFAAIHLMNPGMTAFAFVNLTLFGIFASVVFFRTGNIWLIGAIHSIWNFVQGNFYGINVSGNVTNATILKTVFVPAKEFINGGDFGLEGGLAVSVVLIVGTLLVMFCPPLKKAKNS